MQAYSPDLRRRIVNAVGRGETKTEVARTFEVSRSSVKRYVKMDLQTGSLEPSKPPGPTPKLDDIAQKLLEADLQERPAATLSQRCSFLMGLTGISLGISTLWRTLKRLGYTHKKRSVEASEREEFDRAAWKVLVADQIEAERFVFVDEMGSNTSLTAALTSMSSPLVKAG